MTSKIDGLSIDKIYSSLLLFLLVFSIYLTFDFGWWQYSQPLFHFFTYQSDFVKIYPFFISLFIAILCRVFYISYLKASLLGLIIALITYDGFGPFTSSIFNFITAFFIGRLMLGFRSRKIVGSYWFDYLGLGFSVLILLTIVLSHFKINFTFIYCVFFLFVCFVALKQNLYEVKFGKYFLYKYYKNSEVNLLTGVLIILAAVYVYAITIIPDTGHDSTAVHLNILKIISQSKVWKYDINEYIWAVLPIGAELALLPSYMFGGELSARVSNSIFLLLTGLMIYKFADERIYNKNISTLLGLLVVTMPISGQLIGALYVEPCFVFLLTISIIGLLSNRLPMWIYAATFGAACTMRISGFIFIPLVIYLCWVNILKDKQTKISILYYAAIFILFSSINYLYALFITGNPIFPLMNEIFKSSYYSVDPFYNPFFRNDLGVKNYFYMIFNSKAYGEFSSNGSIGIFLAMFIPFSIIAIILNIKKFKTEIFILAQIVLFIYLIFDKQQYLRYIYPSFSLVVILFILIVAKVSINKFILLTCLFLMVAMNFYKLPYSGPYLPLDISLYLNKDKRDLFVGTQRPYAIVGNLLSKFPEFQGKKILLIGPGFDPSYYYFPIGTIAYSWHSPKLFNEINSMANPEGDLLSVLKKLNVDIVVCRDSQDANDKFQFSTQCKNNSKGFLTIGGIYAGYVLK